VRPLEEVVKAYIAGIVDGEGSVTLMKHHRNETPIPYVSVSNNSLELVKWLKQVAGGIICTRKRKVLHHKTSYVWSVRQDRAIRFLDEIKQYLIIKKPQADLISKRYKSVTSRSGKYTVEMLTKKYELVAQIRKLNQRSIKPPIIRWAPDNLLRMKR
jgi:hypothetical protein